MPDLYFYRDPAEQEKEEAAEIPSVEMTSQPAEYVPATEGTIDFSGTAEIKDWAAETAADNWNATGGANQEWSAPAEAKPW